MNAKLSETHLHRRAVIYLRQSTLKQVVEHTESTRRQYGLRDRALALGWAAEGIEIIDEDLGRSGTSAEGRSGFRRLSEGVAHGSVGAIFALDVSRLARSSADWHRLLDLCGLADVVIADEQAIYDPRDHNDRLLLGIKGTMSEAELMWMGLRLRGARMSKARRGEYYLSAPVGYEWDRAICRLRLDPDEEVQRAVRGVFDRFRLAGSAYAVARHCLTHGLQLPARTPATRELRWSAPRPSRLLAILTNPTYAGAYVYGRRQHTVGLVDGCAVRQCRRVRLEAWQIVHRQHHPGYIEWEEFVKNQQTLRENRPHRDTPGHHGAARQGEALLQGIVLCGKCGHRMNTVYGGKHRRARYACASPVQQGQSMRICWSVAAPAIDHEVAGLVLQVVQPPEVALGLAIVREAESQAQQLTEQWRLRLERMRYEARLAERRYKAVDPDNRVVVRTLEREWEEKLAELAALETRFAEARRQKKVDLTDSDRARILALSRSLPKVWAAPSTTMAERKNIVRTVVREVCLTPARGRATRLEILWQTGAVTPVLVAPQRPGRQTSPKVVALIREQVAQGTPATELAALLNEHSLRTATGAAWSNVALHGLCRYHGIHWSRRMPSSVRRPDRRADGLYSIHGVAATLDTTENAVRYWIQRGWLTRTAGGTRGRPCWFTLDPLTVRRLEQLRDTHTLASRRKTFNRSTNGDAS